MKADERKALLTNDLAKGLEEAYEGVTHPPARTFYWVLGIGCIAIGAGLFYYLTTAAAAASSERWVKLDDAPFPEQLALLAKDGSLADTVQGQLLEFKQARLNLAEGLKLLGVNKTGAIARIETGVKKYEELLKSSSRWPLLQQEALWGAAKGHEALGDLTRAKEWYERLAKEYPNTAMGADSKKQLERLEGSPDLRELSKEFAAEPTGRRN